MLSRKRLLVLVTLAVLATLTIVPVFADFTGTISGFVYAPDGSTPIEGARVWITDAYGSMGINAYTAANGSYSATVNVGTYRLYVNAMGYPTEYYLNATTYNESDFVQVNAGQNLTGINFVLDAPLTFSGRVLAPDGVTGVADALVYLQQENVSGTYFYYSTLSTTRTDASGNYIFRARPGNNIVVQALPTQYPAEYYQNAQNGLNAQKFNLTAGNNVSGINLVMDNGGFIAGTVTGPDGTTPIQNAYVYIYDYTTGNSLGSGMTNASGQYSVPAVPGTYKVSASATGYQFEYYNDATWNNATPVNVTLGATTSNINFALSNGGSITGTVSLPNGAPLVALPRSAYADLFAPAQARQPETVSIAQPRQEPILMRLDDGSVVTAREGGFEPVEQVVSEGAPPLVEQNDALVMQAMNGAQPDTLLTEELVYGFVEVYMSANTYPNYTVPLNADGTYTVAGVSTGTYRVRAVVAGYIREFYGGVFSFNSAPYINVTTGVLTNGIDILLNPAGMISGQVTLASGGVPSAHYVEWFADGYEKYYGCTDVNGNYTLPYAPLNVPVRVRVWGPYDCAGVPTNLVTLHWVNTPLWNSATLVTLTDAAPNFTNMNFALYAGGTITGTVMNAATGSPVANANVTAWDAATGNYLANVFTNVNGQYSLTGLPAGQVKVGASASGLPTEYYNERTSYGAADPVMVTANVTTPGINFTLGSAGGIQGTVYAPDGTTPVANATIDAWENNSGMWLGSTTTNASGHYTLAASAGDYRLRVTSLDYPSEYYQNKFTYWDADVVTVSGSAFTTNINFVLDAPGWITGQVTSAASGLPLYNILVEVIDENFGFQGSDRTDGEGWYTIAVRPGSTLRARVIFQTGYQVQYYNLVTRWADATPLNVVANEVLANINFILNPAGTVSGHTFESDGVTPAHVTAWYDIPGEDYFGYCSNPSTGAYTSPIVPFNTTFTMNASGGCGSTSYVTEWWEESPTQAGATPLLLTPEQPTINGINFTLDSLATISGMVYEADGVTPIPWANVELLDFAGVNNYNLGADSNGYYWAAVAEGNYFASASAAGYATEWYQEAADIGSATLINVWGSVTGIDFTLEAGGAPPATTLIAPMDAITTDSPFMQWVEVPQASMYQIWVGQVGGGYSYNAWYSAGDVCAAGGCGTYLPEPLQAGTYDWWVLTANSYGEGVWSEALRFTVNVTPNPPTQIAPVGTQESQNIAYSWYTVPSASWYYLWVTGPNGHVLDQWYQAGDVCSAGICNVQPSISYGTGDYQWWVQAWSDIYGYTQWSSGLNFMFGALNTPTPLAPIGVVDSIQPNFVWTDEPGVTWYHLWITFPGGAGAEYWFEDWEVCNGNTCSMNTVNIGQGIHSWWVQGWANGVFTPWSAETFFMRPLGTPFATAPLGTISTGMPTFEWSPVPGAYWYYLWVSNDATGYVMDQWYNAYDICGDFSCDVTPALNLADGNYTFWLQAWSPVAGYGNWSAGTQFHVDSGTLTGGEILPGEAQPGGGGAGVGIDPATPEAGS